MCTKQKDKCLVLIIKAKKYILIKNIFKICVLTNWETTSVQVLIHTVARMHCEDATQHFHRNAAEAEPCCTRQPTYSPSASVPGSDTRWENWARVASKLKNTFNQTTLKKKEMDSFVLGFRGGAHSNIIQLTTTSTLLQTNPPEGWLWKLILGMYE